MFSITFNNLHRKLSANYTFFSNIENEKHFPPTIKLHIKRNAMHDSTEMKSNQFEFCLHFIMRIQEM